MKPYLNILLLSMTFLSNCLSAAEASYRTTTGLADAVLQADVVCVGKVSNVQSHGIVQVDTGFTTNGKPVTVAAEKATADVSVQAVYKGDMSPGIISVTFFKNVRTGFNSVQFKEINPGSRNVLFLASTLEHHGWSLTDPALLGTSVIPIGNAPLPDGLTGLEPLRAVLLVLAHSLADQSTAIQMDCLESIGGVGELLNVRPNLYTDADAVKLRAALNEPLTSGLEAFVDGQVLPSVLALTSSPISEVAEQAYLTAGELQDVTVIPKLAEIAEQHYKPGEIGSAASTLSFFRTPAAVRPLTAALDSTDSYVREEAAYALRYLADPAAVPFLINHLSDSDPDVRYYVVTALDVSTGNTHYPGTVLFHKNESEYIQPWQDYAANNRAQLQNARNKASN